jgi:hypothetical protein
MKRCIGSDQIARDYDSADQMIRALNFSDQDLTQHCALWQRHAPIRKVSSSSAADADKPIRRFLLFSQIVY